MSKKVYMYMWEYFVRPEYQEEFEQIYGPDGEWVKLFKKAEGYISTDLYQDQDQPLRYVTTDFWESKKHSEAFRNDFAYDFKKLDDKGELYTVGEEFLGDFTRFS
ncbi:MAG: antibiotic biosynthesis monooxygenase [Calditrichaeota bacterium]|nr:antibiotic biosynthesis monooxygenase [Calditrichota bacterium]